MADFDRESMMEMFTFEMSQLLESLEQNVIKGESGYAMDEINEIFRIMHTIKGSAAMMMFTSISTAAHSIEDLFFYLREESPADVNYSHLTDIVLAGMDFIKGELTKIESSQAVDGDATGIVQSMKDFLAVLKGEKLKVTEPEQKKPASNVAKNYECLIHFEDGCEMENIRAYTLIHNLEEKVFAVKHHPENIVDEASLEYIKRNGFYFEFSSFLEYNEIAQIIESTIYLKDMKLDEIVGGSTNTEVLQEDSSPQPDTPNEDLLEIEKSAAPVPVETKAAEDPSQAAGVKKAPAAPHMISVNVSKLDQLLNLMGELVISEAMVTQNPELAGLELENFHREARQLHIF